MSKVVYVARPATARGEWRVHAAGRAEQFHPSEDDAMHAADELAQFLRGTGEEVAVKVEGADGSWAIARPSRSERIKS